MKRILFVLTLLFWVINPLNAQNIRMDINELKEETEPIINELVEKHLRNIYNFLDSASSEYEKYFTNHI